jgi:acetoacetate decarboxylase
VVREGAVPRINITDIWVDSTRSRDGGRSLWAIPKELATFRLDDRTLGPVARTGWNASTQGLPVAAAGFTGVHRPAPRVPLRFATSQQREDGTTVVAGVSGSAQSTLSVGRWDFDVDGPLGWLHGRRPLASFRMSGFRLTFGT